MTFQRGVTRRVLSVERTYNTRDIGGYATADGRATVRGAIFRSDSLHDVTRAGRQTMLEAGIRAVIDLRGSAELAQLPNTFVDDPEIAYHHLPFHVIGPKPDTEIYRDIAGLYASFLEHDGARIASVFRALGASDAPIVIHCHAGKDRTGVAVALLLSHLGVPAATIVEDYAASAGFLQPLTAVWRSQAERVGQDLTRFDVFMQSPPSAMMSTLDLLNARYGGATRYLRSVGVEDSHLERLTERLTRHSHNG